MKETRVIIYGMGTIGREVVQCLDTKNEVVGAIDLQHVGEISVLSGLDKELGVKITDDADKLFDEVEADVLFHLITTTVDDCAKQLKKPIAKKMQIITSAEEMVNPYYYNKEQSAAIDKMAKDAGVSVLGSGLWPTYMDVYIPLALTGGVREIKRLEYRRKADFKPYADSLVVPKFGLRQTKEEFEKNLEEGNVVGHTGFEGTFLTFCDMFGWKLEDVKTNFVPYIRRRRQSLFRQTHRNRYRGRRRTPVQRDLGFARGDGNRPITTKSMVNRPLKWKFRAALSAHSGGQLS